MPAESAAHTPGFERHGVKTTPGDVRGHLQLNQRRCIVAGTEVGMQKCF